MAKRVLLGLLALIALVLIFAVTRPDTFRVERSIAVKAEPSKVYALLNDFHQFPSWSPWQNLDPAMQATHSGAPSGPGAVYAWTGNDTVGAGRMEILQAVPNTSVTVKLDFFKPFEAHNTTQYTLTGQKGFGDLVMPTMWQPTARTNSFTVAA